MHSPILFGSLVHSILRRSLDLYGTICRSSVPNCKVHGCVVAHARASPAPSKMDIGLAIDAISGRESCTGEQHVPGYELSNSVTLLVIVFGRAHAPSMAALLASVSLMLLPLAFTVKCYRDRVSFTYHEVV
jgi:hypothetical protein